MRLEAETLIDFLAEGGGLEGGVAGALINGDVEEIAHELLSVATASGRGDDAETMKARDFLLGLCVEKRCADGLVIECGEVEIDTFSGEQNFGVDVMIER